MAKSISPALQLGGDGFFRFGGGGAGQQGAPDAQVLQQGGQAVVVLLGQDLRGGHQGRLAAVLYAEVHAGGGHHGLAGAHVPLDQPVHGGAGAHIGKGLLHTAALGVRQGEGERGIERLHVHAAAGRHVDHLPALAEPIQADGEEEQLLKGQPPPGQVQGLRALREVDVLVGVLDAAELVLPPHLIRQHVRQDVGTGGKPLADGPGQNQLADPGGKGVDGHDAAGDLPPALRLHHGIGHLAAEEGALRPAVEDVRLPLVQVVLQPRLVEEGHVQGAGVVHRPELYQVQPPADMGDGGGRRHQGRYAGGLAGHQVRDAAELGAVVIGPGEVGDQVPQGGDAQLAQGFGPLLPDALDIPHVCVQVRHGITSRLVDRYGFII